MSTEVSKKYTAPKSQVGDLICITHQHYHRQWLPSAEWSHFRRWACGKDRWLWRERLWEKEGLKTKVESAMRNVNNRSRIRAWWREDKSWVMMIYQTDNEQEGGGTLFYKWGAACRKERFVILRLEWFGGWKRLTSDQWPYRVDWEGCTVMRLRR